MLNAVDAADADPDAGTDGAATPGDVDRADAAAAVAAARDYTRNHGGTTKQDLVKNVMPTHPLGYDVDAALAGRERRLANVLTAAVGGAALRVGTRARAELEARLDELQSSGLME